MPQYEERECKHHGKYQFALEGRGYYRCTKCRSEAVQRRREKLKKKAVEHKGGECKVCGYNKCVDALEFHHRDPNTKEFGVAAKGYTRSWDKVKEELDKCDMLCANCHRELHAEQ
jgi:hypothetical protein